MTGLLLKIRNPSVFYDQPSQKNWNSGFFTKFQSEMKRKNVIFWESFIPSYFLNWYWKSFWIFTQLCSMLLWVNLDYWKHCLGHPSRRGNEPARYDIMNFVANNYLSNLRRLSYWWSRTTWINMNQYESIWINRNQNFYFFALWLRYLSISQKICEKYEIFWTFFVIFTNIETKEQKKQKFWLR